MLTFRHTMEALLLVTSQPLALCGGPMVIQHHCRTQAAAHFGLLYVT
jgi:hypothetical protein